MYPARMGSSGNQRIVGTLCLPPRLVMPMNREALLKAEVRLRDSCLTYLNMV